MSRGSLSSLEGSRGTAKGSFAEDRQESGRTSAPRRIWAAARTSRGLSRPEDTSKREGSPAVERCRAQSTSPEENRGHF